MNEDQAKMSMLETHTTAKTLQIIVSSFSDQSQEWGGVTCVCGVAYSALAENAPDDAGLQNPGRLVWTLRLQGQNHFFHRAFSSPGGLRPLVNYF